MHCLWRVPTIHRPQEAARVRATLGKSLRRPLAWPSHCLWRAAASGAPSEAKAASRQLLRAEKLVVVITAIVVAIMTTDNISKISDIPPPSSSSSTWAQRVRSSTACPSAKHPEAYVR